MHIYIYNSSSTFSEGRRASDKECNRSRTIELVICKGSTQNIHRSICFLKPIFKLYFKLYTNYLLHLAQI